MKPSCIILRGWLHNVVLVKICIYVQEKPTFCSFKNFIYFMLKTWGFSRGGVCLSIYFILLEELLCHSGNPVKYFATEMARHKVKNLGGGKDC